MTGFLKFDFFLTIVLIRKFGLYSSSPAYITQMLNMIRVKEGPVRKKKNL